MLHAKTLTVDDEVAIVGTANLDRRSLYLNYELMLLVPDAEFTGRLRASQQRLLAAAPVLDPAWATRRSGARRVLEDTVKLASPIL